MSVGSFVASQVKSAVIDGAVSKGASAAASATAGAIRPDGTDASQELAVNGENLPVDQPQIDEKGLVTKAVQGTANLAGDIVQVVGTIAATVPVVGDAIETGTEIIGGGIKMAGAAVTFDGDQLQEEAAVTVGRTAAAMAPVSIGTVVLKGGAEEIIRAGFEMKNSGVETAASNDANYEQDISPRATPGQNVEQQQETGRA
jgi:hypothetical protein